MSARLRTLITDFIKKVNVHSLLRLDEKELSIDDIHTVLQTVLGGPEDLNSPVSLKTLGEELKNLDFKKIREDLYEIAELIYNFLIGNQFSCNQNDFDNFFFAVCDRFLLHFNSVANTCGCECIKFGKAQKLINITFKYIYCFGDAEKYKNVLAYCHMPIDRIILKEMKNRLDLNSIVIVNQDGQEIIKYKGKSWSFFDKETYKDLLLKYREKMQLLQIYPKKTWMECEFEWWHNSNPSPSQK